MGPLPAEALQLAAPIPVDAPRYAPGDVIDEKYRLERLLGEGAQGSVWLAENLALGSGVALKLVHGEPDNPAPILRLEKEARAAAQIGHAAVVRVFDLGHTPSGDAFIVMEFLEGESLGQRLGARGRLPPIEAVRTLLPIADVLDAAHARGIVHRDLKPENVFLAASGGTLQPKLLDFGIAKFRDPRRDERAITQVGTIVGSPAYAAPEQTLCRAEVGRAADIWAFSVVLYECLTGAVPFWTEDYADLFRRIEEEPPRPTLAYGVGDLELWEIVRRGLEKNPDARWPSMLALGQALARWLDRRGVQDDVSGVLIRSKWLKGEPRTPRLERPRAPRRSAGAHYAMIGVALALFVATGLLAVFPSAGRADEGTGTPVVIPPPLPAPLEAVHANSPGAQRKAAPRVTPPAADRAPRQPKAALTPAAMVVPDGGVPRTVARKPRRSNDLLNPY